jgi:hypothetical protein
VDVVIVSVIVVMWVIYQAWCGRVGEGGIGSCSGVKFPNFGGKGGAFDVTLDESGVVSLTMGERGWFGSGGGV